jgi:hypothetical protein
MGRRVVVATTACRVAAAVAAAFSRLVAHLARAAATLVGQEEVLPEVRLEAPEQTVISVVGAAAMAGVKRAENPASAVAAAVAATRAREVLVGHRFTALALEAGLAASRAAQAGPRCMPGAAVRVHQGPLERQERSPVVGAAVVFQARAQRAQMAAA